MGREIVVNCSSYSCGLPDGDKFSLLISLLILPITSRSKSQLQCQFVFMPLKHLSTYLLNDEGKPNVHSPQHPQYLASI